MTESEEKSFWGKALEKLRSLFGKDEIYDFDGDDSVLRRLLKASHARAIRDVNIAESYNAMKDFVARYNGDADKEKDEANVTKVVDSSEEKRGVETNAEEDSKFSKVTENAAVDNIDRAIASVTGGDVNEVHKERDAVPGGIQLVPDNRVENGEIGSAVVNDPEAIRFSMLTEDALVKSIKKYASSKDAERLGWVSEQIEEIAEETNDLFRFIHAGISGNPDYDEFAKKNPTMRIDWRDGEEKPTVTWVRNNIEYKYDMSADTFCINNEALETIFASPVMADLMIHTANFAEYNTDDYLTLYETLRDLGFVVPCKGCFDAAGRIKMLPSVAQKFVDQVNQTIDERNKDPKAFDDELRKMEGVKGKNGLPVKSPTKGWAIRIGVAGDNLTEHISWTQLMSAEGQTRALADWGGIFCAWQKTGAGRPKDKLLPEPYTGQIISKVSTIIAPYGEKTPSFRDLVVNKGTGLRRNSHSEFRPTLVVDELQFLRDAWIRKLCVFKYVKELDDVRLAGNMGVKYNMSGFPAYVEGAKAAGLNPDGTYAIAEESVGGREFPYTGEDGNTHYDGYKGLEEAKKYINKDVSLSSVAFSVPHFIKLLTDVPTPTDKAGIWGSIIPCHVAGATAHSLKAQGLGDARAVRPGKFLDEAFSEWGKGVTNFEDVQNDRYGEGYVVKMGEKEGADANGLKMFHPYAQVLRNEALGVTIFLSPSYYKAYGAGGLDKVPSGGKFYTLDSEDNSIAHPLVVDYNDKVRELGDKYAYKEAADYYINELKSIGLLPRFDFDVPEEVFLRACMDAKVDPRHPKLGWKGEGHSWSPIDAESYYSVWCDYGMTDPATGEYAPHRPILDGQTNADAFEKALPMNYLDIIRDGLNRYTDRKDREEARINEAVREYVKREIAQGKMEFRVAKDILVKHGLDGGGLMFSKGIAEKADDTSLDPSVVTSEQKRKIINRINGWLTDERISELMARIASLDTAGMSKEEIREAKRVAVFEMFDNTPEVIGYIDEGYLPYFKQEILDDNRIYSGKAYFIDHALFSHPEIKIEDYSRIVDILSAPNMVKLDERHNNVSLIFIRQYGKYYAEVVRSAEDGKLLLHKTSYYKDKIPQKALPNVEPIKVSEGGSVSIDPAKAVTSTRLSVFDTIGKDTNSSEDSNKSGNIISKKEERRSSLAVETGDVPREEQTVKFSKVTDPEIIRRFNEGEKIVTYREVVLNEDESFNSPMASSPITSPEGICLSVMSSRR